MNVALDSNVLVHAFNRDDPTRHSIARDILKRAVATGGIVPAQVLGEFLAVIRRKLPAEGVRAARFADQILASASVVETTGENIATGVHLAARYRLQFWDRMIIAVARANYAEILLTEDMQDGQVIDGVRLVNPFNPANRAFVDDLLTPA